MSYLKKSTSHSVIKGARFQLVLMAWFSLSMIVLSTVTLLSASAQLNGTLDSATEKAKGQNKNAEAPESPLHRSCRLSIGKKQFQYSYCATFINATLSGFMAVTQSLRPQLSGKCSTQRREAIAKMHWLSHLPPNIDTQKIAHDYLKFKRDSKVQNSIGYNDLKSHLLDEDEIDIAISMSRYKRAAQLAINKSNSDTVKELYLVLSTPDLYRSCQEFKDSDQKKGSESICNAVISGVRVGYQLAKFDLSVNAEGAHCRALLKKELADFTTHVHKSITCEVDERPSNQITASEYLSSINTKGSAIEILHIGAEHPHLQMIRVINSQCSAR